MNATMTTYGESQAAKVLATREGPTSCAGSQPEFDEQWAERIHQEGASFDSKYRNLGEYRAAASRAS